MTKRELSIFTGGILAVIALVGGTVGHFIGLEQAIAGLTRRIGLRDRLLRLFGFPNC